MDSSTASRSPSRCSSSPPIPRSSSCAARRSIAGSAKTLYDYFTIANLYQPCAALSPRATGSPGAAFVPLALATNRCTALKAKGLLTTSSTAAQAEESLDKLLAAGWQPDSNLLHASHYAFATPPVVATYANSYGRFSVADNLCGYSYRRDRRGEQAHGARPGGARADLRPIQRRRFERRHQHRQQPEPGRTAARSGVDIAVVGRARFQRRRRDLPSQPVDGYRCATRALKTGLNETLRTANLHGKPAIIVHGRADALIPVTSPRARTYGQNKIVEGAASKLVLHRGGPMRSTSTRSSTTPGCRDTTRSFVPLALLLHPGDGRDVGVPDRARRCRRRRSCARCRAAARRVRRRRSRRRTFRRSRAPPRSPTRSFSAGTR